MKRNYKILITNHALKEFRGSETYCYTLAKELSKHNELYVYTPKQGKVSDKMSKFAQILNKPKGDFDIILYNHNNTISKDFNAKCKIYTIQGLTPKLEKPPKEMDIYIAISDEIAKYYKQLSPVIIYNGIDTQKFKPSIKTTHENKNVLFSSDIKGSFPIQLFWAVKSLGLNFRRIGTKKTRKENIIDDLLWSDIVIGLGRTALEAMSCNKKIIIADKRKYNLIGMDGHLNQQNVLKSQKYNYSGRAFQKKITFLSIRKELKKAKQDKTDWERNWILKHHNIKNVAEKYINLAEKFINNY